MSLVVIIRIGLKGGLADGLRRAGYSPQEIPCPLSFTYSSERPIRDEEGNIVVGQRGKAKGKPQADSSLKGTQERAPIRGDRGLFLPERFFLISQMHGSTTQRQKHGYSIPFNRHF